MTALVLVLVLGFGALCAFVAYWHGVAAAEQRHRDERVQHRALQIEHDRLRHQYRACQEVNQDLARRCSDLQMRETFREIVRDGWAS